MITSYFESDNNAPAHGSITRICSTIVVAYNIASDFAVMQRSLSEYKVFTFYTEILGICRYVNPNFLTLRA